MPKLLELSFGPVQDFIASARRTADLWAGSRMLSEAARAAGLALLEAKATLIYPDPQRVQQAVPDQSNLSNVLLAQVPDGIDMHQLTETCIRAARDVIITRGEQVLHQYPALRQEIFHAQLNDALEAYAAWADFPNGSSYQDAYKQLKKAFSQRKNTRDFLPAPSLHERLPKNSFDGLRETVLPESDHGERLRRGKWRKLRLGNGEQLDALGVLKRVTGNEGEGRFAALTRLAAHDWIQDLAQRAPERLASLIEAHEPLVSLGLVSRCPSNGGAFDAFPYDGALLFPERLEVAFGDADDCDDPDRCREGLKVLRSLLRSVWREFGRPLPYAALLVADGDRMGKFVAAAQSVDHHGQLTRALAGFADQSIQVFRSEGGQAIYAGGEDVMGLLPLSASLRVARQLSQSFAHKVRDLHQALTELDAVDHPPTLRVGIAIAHIQQPLGSIRRLAESAEKFAKGDAGTDQQGNALGLRLHIRAGHVLSWRLPFTTQGEFQVLEKWILAYQEGKLSTRVGYDLRAIADRLQLQHLPGGLVPIEMQRLLQQKQQKGGGAEIDKDLRQALVDRLAALCQEDPPSPEHSPPSEHGAITQLRRLGEELILARWLSAHQQGDLLAGERA